MTISWLLVLFVAPLLGALVVMLLPKGADKLAKQVGLALSLIVFGLTVAAATQFDVARAAQFQLGFSYDWIPTFGVHFAMGVDGIALVLIALST